VTLDRRGAKLYSVTLPRTLTDHRGRLLLDDSSGVLWWIFAATERPRIGRWPSPRDPEPVEPRFLMFLSERDEAAYEPCPSGWRDLAASELEQLLRVALGDRHDPSARNASTDAHWSR
jgi:hypothetical protein